MNFTAWSDAHPVLSHALETVLIAATGTTMALLGGASPYWSFAIGVFCAAMWIGSQEQTDERVHRMLESRGKWRGPGQAVAVEVGSWWHGWDWKDFWGGILGGVVGSVATVVVWALVT